MVFGHKERCGRVSGPEYVHGPALFHLITGPLTIFWHCTLFSMLELMLEFSLICAVWSSMQFTDKRQKNWTQDSKDEYEKENILLGCYIEG